MPSLHIAHEQPGRYDVRAVRCGSSSTRTASFRSAQGHRKAQAFSTRRKAARHCCLLRRRRQRRRERSSRRSAIGGLRSAIHGRLGAISPSCRADARSCAGHACGLPARQAVVTAAVRPACHGRRAAARPEPAARAVPTVSGGLATGHASAVRARRGCARRRLSYTLTAGKGGCTHKCDARAARAGRVRRGSGGAVLPPLTCQGCAVGGPPASPRLVDRRVSSRHQLERHRGRHHRGNGREPSATLCRL